MKVLGKFFGGYNIRNVAVGSYTAFEATWINVETYSGSSITEDKRCFLKLGTTYLVAEIKSTNGDYIDPEIANSLVKDIVQKDVFDLDTYDMGFWGVYDIRPDSICISNEVDEDGNPIPLEVVGI